MHFQTAMDTFGDLLSGYLKNILIAIALIIGGLFLLFYSIIFSKPKLENISHHKYCIVPITTSTLNNRVIYSTVVRDKNTFLLICNFLSDIESIRFCKTTSYNYRNITSYHLKRQYRLFDVSKIYRLKNHPCIRHLILDGNNKRELLKRPEYYDPFIYKLESLTVMGYCNKNTIKLISEFNIKNYLLTISSIIQIVILF